MRFSKRTAWNLTENSFAAAVRHRKHSGLELLDLTVANPTICGFQYDTPSLLAPLLQPAALTYEPEPFGMLSARQAVKNYYSDHRAVVAPDKICLTTSTSEAYSFLFRLLCDPGDEVLAAKPSYPLFDFIAQLDSVELSEYPLWLDPHVNATLEEQAWSIDLQQLEAAITSRTRAVLLIHPNNPTGNFASLSERAALAQICSRHGLALIVDEVFLDYAIGDREGPTFVGDDWPCLTFVLSGLSKVCGLPQMKCSWIVAGGPAQLVREAMARLEIVADTYLSMNSVVQHALPAWLSSRHGLQQQIRDRMRANLRALDRRLAGSQADRSPVDGGWTVVVRVPRDVEEVPFVIAALACGVLVQPGSFYGLPDGRIVLSLLTPPDVWARGLKLLPID